MDRTRRRAAGAAGSRRVRARPRGAAHHERRNRCPTRRPRRRPSPPARPLAESPTPPRPLQPRRLGAPPTADRRPTRGPTSGDSRRALAGPSGDGPRATPERRPALGPDGAAEAPAPARLARRPQPPQAGTGSRARARRRGRPAADDADDDDDDDDEPDRHDYTDAAADRGLTTDDVAEDALEEAGLAPRPTAAPASATSRPGSPAPRSATRRPAPRPAPAAAARRAAAPPTATPAAPRRQAAAARGGGRGRGARRCAAAGGARRGTAPAGAAAAARHRSAQPRRGRRRARRPRRRRRPARSTLDDDVARAPPRPHPQGPPGRSLPDVRARRSRAAHPHRGARGPQPGRALAGHARRATSRSTATSTSAGCRTCCPGMEAAFVDIGTPKNGVLYRGDVAFDKADVEGGNKPKIERLLKNGQMITVQVTKNPIAHKGARLTQEVSLAGRFLVMVPGEPETYGISKRLPDDERKRLRKVLDGIRPTTPASSCAPRPRARRSDELERDVRRLRNQWEQISALADQLEAGEAPLPGARPRAAAHPRGVHQGVPRRRHRRPRALRGDPRLRRGDRARARRPGRVLRRRGGGPPDLRALPHLTSSCSRRSTARCGCRRAARSSSSAPRRSP